MSIFKSIKGLFGQTIHYKDGVRVGETWDGLLPGTKKHYDSDGRYAGSSSTGLFADEVHYNEYGGRVGETWKDDFGFSHHYDDQGKIGTSYDGFTSTITIFDELHDAPFDRSYDESDASDLSFDSSDW